MGLLNANSVLSSSRSAGTYSIITIKSLDILGLTETKVLQDSPALMHCTPPTHQVFHNARASSRGGGVAIISSKRLACKKLTHPHNVSSFEFLAVQFDGLHKTCSIMNIYRPPSGNFVTFLDEFSAVIDHLTTPNRDLIIMGGFNIHVNDLSDSLALRFLGVLNDLSLQNHVTVPTYRHSSHTLDLVIDSYIDPRISKVEVCDVTSFSDHNLVTFDLQCPPFYAKVDKCIEYRLYHDIDHFETQIRSILNALDLDPNDESSLVDNLNYVLTSQRDEFFPLASKIITLCASAPWFNGACKEAKTKCRRLERRYRNHPSVVSKNAYLSALAEYNTTLRTTKAEYYSSLFSELRGNPRKLYATVSILKGKSQDRILPDLSRTNPLLPATRFNDYLLGKIANIRFELDRLDINPSAVPFLQCDSLLSDFNRISAEDFEEIYNRCKITSCPLDPLDYRKVSPAFLKGYFRDVINSVFTSNLIGIDVFPASEKRGIVYPQLKGHDLDYELLSSYRPITNVS